MNAQPGRHIDTPEEYMDYVLALGRAVASLMNVVEELAAGLAAGQTPEREWAEWEDLVASTFQLHRRELGGEPVVWPSRGGES